MFFSNNISPIVIQVIIGLMHSCPIIRMNKHIPFHFSHHPRILRLTKFVSHVCNVIINRLIQQIPRPWDKPCHTQHQFIPPVQRLQRNLMLLHFQGNQIFFRPIDKEHIHKILHNQIQMFFHEFVHIYESYHQ